MRLKRGTFVEVGREGWEESERKERTRWKNGKVGKVGRGKMEIVREEVKENTIPAARVKLNHSRVRRQ
jgi:hypothetical protein